MILKQGSLLFTWAYATKSATKFGASHVAAHQVALSVWMVFAYILDAVSVSAQVLLSKARARKDMREVRSIAKYMISVATVQGFIITIIIAALGHHVPSFFTKDEAVIAQLKALMPVLSMQQVLISLTFVLESLAAGGSQFLLPTAWRWNSLECAGKCHSHSHVKCNQRPWHLEERDRSSRCCWRTSPRRTAGRSVGSFEAGRRRGRR